LIGALNMMLFVIKVFPVFIWYEKGLHGSIYLL
jgi:hypothetical protein